MVRHSAPLDHRVTLPKHHSQKHQTSRNITVVCWWHTPAVRYYGGDRRYLQLSADDNIHPTDGARHFSWSRLSPSKASEDLCPYRNGAVGEALLLVLTVACSFHIAGLCRSGHDQLITWDLLFERKFGKTPYQRALPQGFTSVPITTDRGLDPDID